MAGLSKQDETFQTIKVNKRNFRVHPKYNTRTQAKDIAFVLLPVDLDFNENIQPVQLLAKTNVGELFVGQRVDIMDWGWVSDTHTLSSIQLFLWRATIASGIKLYRYRSSTAQRYA